MASSNYIIGVIAMELIELVKHFMSMRAGWVVLVAIVAFIMMLGYGVLKSASDADRLEEELLCKNQKNAGRKQKYTPASLVTSALSASGITASNKNSKIAEPSGLTTPGDLERAKNLDHVKWKKYRANGKPRRKSNES